MIKNTAWETKDEVNFINKLGSFYNSFKEDPEEVESITIPKSAEVKKYVLACLEGYIKGFNDRVDWGSIDKIEVLKAVATRYIMIKHLA